MKAGELFRVVRTGYDYEHTLVHLRAEQDFTVDAELAAWIGAHPKQTKANIDVGAFAADLCARGLASECEVLELRFSEVAHYATLTPEADAREWRAEADVRRAKAIEEGWRKVIGQEMRKLKGEP